MDANELRAQLGKILASAGSMIPQMQVAGNHVILRTHIGNRTSVGNALSAAGFQFMSEVEPDDPDNVEFTVFPKAGQGVAEKTYSLVDRLVSVIDRKLRDEEKESGEYDLWGTFAGELTTSLMNLNITPREQLRDEFNYLIKAQRNEVGALGQLRNTLDKIRNNMRDAGIGTEELYQQFHTRNNQWQSGRYSGSNPRMGLEGRLSRSLGISPNDIVAKSNGIHIRAGNGEIAHRVSTILRDMGLAYSNAPSMQGNEVLFVVNYPSRQWYEQH